jgi:hypothetical protein
LNRLAGRRLQQRRALERPVPLHLARALRLHALAGPSARLLQGLALPPGRSGLSATFQDPAEYCDSMHRESGKKCSSSRGAMQGPAESQAGRGFPGRRAILRAEPDSHASQPRRAIGVVLDAHLVCLSPALERVSERDVHLPMITVALDFVDPERRPNRPPFDIGVAAPGLLQPCRC